MNAPSRLTPWADIAPLNREIADLRKDLLLAQASLAACLDGHPNDADAVAAAPAFDRLLEHLQRLESQGAYIEEYLQGLGATPLDPSEE